MGGLETQPLRLQPGDDLREALQAALQDARDARGVQAAFVLAGIGSLGVVCLRLAGAAEATRVVGEHEILTLSGTVAVNGIHLHASVADAAGRVSGGHVAPGCVVRTTAEVLLAWLPGWSLHRAPDAATGYAELVVSAATGAEPPGAAPCAGPPSAAPFAESPSAAPCAAGPPPAPRRRSRRSRAPARRRPGA